MNLKSMAMLLLVVTLAAVGCGKTDTPAPAGQAVPAAQEPGASVDGSLAADTAAEPRVTFDNVLIKERPALVGPGYDWEVRATLVNGDGAPLDGGEFVVDLTRKGEVAPFVRHSAQIFFTPAIVPGKSTGFSAVIPAGNVTERPAVEGVDVVVKLTKVLPKRVVAAAWTPLNPELAEAKVVSPTVVIAADGTVLGTLPGPGEAAAPGDAAAAEPAPLASAAAGPVHPAN